MEIYLDEAELPAQRLSVHVTDQLIFGSLVLHIEAGARLLSLALVINDALASVHQLRINYSADGGLAFSLMDRNCDEVLDAADLMPAGTSSFVLPQNGFNQAFTLQLYLVEALSGSGEVLASSASIGPSGLDTDDVIQ